MATTQKDKGYQALVAGFNLYKTPGVRDALDELHISTCYSGVVVDGPAEVVSTAERVLDHIPCDILLVRSS